MINKLSLKYPWPQQSPNYPFDQGGWFPVCNQKILSEFLSEKTKIIIELGSWMGLSTRWILDNAPKAVVIAIDHWQGDPNAKIEKDKPIFEIFISNCWSYRNRLIPMKTTTEKGLKEVKELNIIPDLIYIDAGHDYDSAKNDIKNSLLFDCPVVGDDFNPNSWPGVVRAVWEEANNYNRKFTVLASTWKIGEKK